MRIQDNLQSWNLKLKKEIKTRTFWVALVFGIITSTGSILGYSNPQFVYLQIPFAILILSTLPGLAGLAFSIRFSSIMFWLDKNAFNYWQKNKIQYFQNYQFQEKGSYLNYAKYNLLYATGIILLILRTTTSIYPTTESNLPLLTIALGFNAIIFGSGINLAISVIKMKSVFSENKSDGSIVNFGNLYRTRINFALGFVQIIFFVYEIRKDVTFYPFLISLALSMMICFVSSLTSYYALKKFHIQKLLSQFDKKNGRYIFPDYKGCP